MNNANHVLSGGEFPAAVAGPSTSRTQQPQSQLNNMLGSADVVKWTKDILKFNVCRICVTYHDSGPELVSIFTQRPNEKESFADLINKYLPIQVSERDTLPCVVCRACACKLTDWHGMVRACLDSAQLLAAQADRIATGRSYILTPERNDKSRLSETVREVLASYSLDLHATEFVCQACRLKTTREQFHRHLSDKHASHTESREDIEAFIRDHVTFEEVLLSESEGEVDHDSVASEPSSETVEWSALSLHCPQCRSAFSTGSRLFHHMTSHPEVCLAGGVGCCGRTYGKSELVKHSLERHASTSTDRACRSCGHVAAHAAALAAHVAIAHPDSRPDTKTPGETNQKRIPAVCPECNDTFSNKYNMLAHMRRHASGAARGAFPCPCGKAYSTRGNLAAHRRVAHGGALAHACPRCGEAFPTRGARDAHARRHLGARPYACAHCPRTFHATNSRNKHQLEAHAPPRYACRLCDKRFKRSAHLQYHVRTHRPTYDTARAADAGDR